ncbi:MULTISPECIES: hypothetical protein [Bacillaceae]|uniref:Uncharacterized protein n=1 Tax=Evansella alkalicola TaxID=745819 RepID=A0ABS6JSD8_9BACI|nr:MULTISPECIES: hypothetical protein [Bacillaceae]MBU9721474.1 hypothetical protein [Bacillus alkalicola]
MSLDAFIMGLAFIIIHLAANQVLPSNRMKRLRWFSFSGGLAVSYVFVYVLPSLHKEQVIVKKYTDYLTMESELYFIGLIGVLIFYGIQKFVRKVDRKGDPKKHTTLFFMQIIFFAIYNMLVAYITVSSDVAGIQAVFYGLAIGLHFIAIAHDLWREYGVMYNQIGRYVLVLGIIAGWITGMLVQLSPLLQSIVFAFISGAMILNVLKYELPPDGEAHFPTFAIGVVAYTSITMSLKFFFQW